MSEKETIARFTKAQDSLVIQQSDFSLLAISQMVGNKSIDISPHYQRRDRWSLEKQSALIESFLLNVPVPPVYLSEDDYGTYSVIDGKQRISAICDFLSGKLKLKALKEFDGLIDKTFDELPMQLKNALTIRPYIRVITLLRQSDPSLKYEVFLRLNTGGEKLKPQEIRNVAYSGKLNDLLFQLAENPILKSQLKITNDKSTAYRNMDDVEHVLRFFTIQDDWKNIGGKLSEQMDNYMLKNRNIDPTALENLFNKSINGCQNIWGEYVFKKFINNANWREQFISPLFDAQMVAVSVLTTMQISALVLKRGEVCEKTKELFNDEKFVKSISQSTNNSSAIESRITFIFYGINHLSSI